MWGSGLAGMLCAVAALATGVSEPWRIGFVASFVSKLSDTVSSEIGKVNLLQSSITWLCISGASSVVLTLQFLSSAFQSASHCLCGVVSQDVSAMQAYGQTTYLITTLTRVPRGTEGAISAEGTLAGAGAALGFAALAGTIGQV